MSKRLSAQRCVPCEGGVPNMAIGEARKYVKLVPGWKLDKASNGEDMIVTSRNFPDFRRALVFVNKVGEIAESEGHHPNIYMHSWNKVKLELYTHAIGGLSMNDFIVAAKINEKLPGKASR